jgi:hypothetical protein
MRDKGSAWENYTGPDIGTTRRLQGDRPGRSSDVTQQFDFPSVQLNSRPLGGRPSRRWPDDGLNPPAPTANRPTSRRRRRIRPVVALGVPSGFAQQFIVRRWRNRTQSRQPRPCDAVPVAPPASRVWTSRSIGIPPKISFGRVSGRGEFRVAVAVDGAVVGFPRCQRGSASSARTSDSRYLRCPPGVLMDPRRPVDAHRVTVFGSTLNSAATSAGVNKRAGLSRSSSTPDIHRLTHSPKPNSIRRMV